MVFGNATAGGAYVTGSETTPVLVDKAAEGVPRRPAAGQDGPVEETTTSLGGADMHSRVSAWPTT